MSKIETIHIKYRFLFVLFVIGVILIINSWNCLLLRFEGIPHIISQRAMSDKLDTVLLLYGAGLCGTCPTGSVIYNMGKNNGVLTVVPGDFTANEIRNLKDALPIEGPLIKGDKQVAHFIKRVSACLKSRQPQTNVILKLSKDLKIKTIKLL